MQRLSAVTAVAAVTSSQQVRLQSTAKPPRYSGGRDDEGQAYRSGTSPPARHRGTSYQGRYQSYEGRRDSASNIDPLRSSQPSRERPIPKIGIQKQMPIYKRVFDHHKHEESVRFAKREQYTRIYEFLRGLRKSTTAADNWQVSVAALRDAAERGTPVTSDLISEAIESCCAAKQYETASDLFYKFHFDYNVARGAKATLAFLRVCAATGQYEAAKRAVEWVGAGGSTAATSSSPAALLTESGEDDKEFIAKARQKRKEAKDRKRKSAAEDMDAVPSELVLTVEMLTLFLRSAFAVSDDNLFLFQYYPDAIATYARLRCSARNAPHVVTNPLLIEALVNIHCRAKAHDKAYELLLKTVRLLSVDSGRDRYSTDTSNQFASTKASAKLRKLLQVGDDDAVAEGAAKDAQPTSSSIHGALLSDGSVAGKLNGTSASALDDILGKMGIKSPIGRDGDDEGSDAATEAAKKFLQISIDDKGSLDALTKETDTMDDPDMSPEERVIRADAQTRMKETLSKESSAIHSFSEIEMPSTSQNKERGSSSTGAAVHLGPLPSNITYITERTFDAVIKVCFMAKKHVWVYKTAYLAISLGPAASGGYAPDEAAARMLIFSIEEVTAQIYECVGGNIPNLQMKAEYLQFCSAERERLRATIAQRKLNEFEALKGKLLTESSSSHGRKSLSDFKVSDTELLLALPDELVFSTSDLESRLNAWKFSLQLFKGLADKGFPLFPQTYESPFRTFIAAGKPDKAAEMMEEMKKDGRIIPSYCHQRLLCERIAHEPSSQRAQQLMVTLETFTSKKDSPAVLNSMLRHAMYADHHRLFRNTAKEMQTLQVVEDRQKLILTIRQRIASHNIMGALAAYSRLNNTLGLEGRRSKRDSNFKVYESDFFIPQPLIHKLLTLADSYINDQTQRRQRVEMLERSGAAPPSPPMEGNGRQFSGSSLRHQDFWNEEQQRNLDTAKVIRKSLKERVGAGYTGQYLALDLLEPTSPPSQPSLR